MRNNKQIEQVNKYFQGLSPSEKRVAIAKDVLAQLKANKYLASRRTYVGPIYLKSDEVVDNFDFDYQKSCTELESCNVCALGGLMLSLTSFNDKFTIGELEEGDGTLWRELSKFFSAEQIFLIEYCFEGWMSWSDGAAINDLDFYDEDWANDENHPIWNKIYDYYYSFKDDTARLEGIMKNIVKNKGEFIPFKI